MEWRAGPAQEPAEPELILDPVLSSAAEEPAEERRAGPAQEPAEPESIAAPVSSSAAGEPAEERRNEPAQEPAEPELSLDPVPSSTAEEAAEQRRAEPPQEPAEPKLIPNSVLSAAAEEATVERRAESAQKPAEPELIPDPVSSSVAEEAAEQRRAGPAHELPETERILDRALLVALGKLEQHAEERVGEPVQEQGSGGQLEPADLTELAAAVGSSDIDPGEDRGSAGEDSESGAPWPTLQPRWHALQLEAAPAAVALLAPPLRPLAPAPPVLEPAVANVVPDAQFAALPPADTAALESPKPIPVPMTVPALRGKPEPLSAFSLPAPGLPLAPLQDYTAPACRQIRPVPPLPQILRPDAGPRITLPGPALPAQLHSLQNAGIATILANRPRTSGKSAPGWLTTALVTVLLLWIGMVAVFDVIPRMVAGGNSTPPAPVGAKTASEEVEASTVSPMVSHPLSKSVEVTGFRFSGDAGMKPEVHYVVVNHSNVGLDDVTVYVTLRASGAKPGQPPLSRFSFRTTGLGPYQSSEMTSPIEKLPRAGALPEWQDLRADVQLGP